MIGKNNLVRASTRNKVRSFGLFKIVLFDESQVLELKKIYFYLFLGRARSRSHLKIVVLAPLKISRLRNTAKWLEDLQTRGVI